MISSKKYLKLLKKKAILESEYDYDIVNKEELITKPNLKLETFNKLAKELPSYIADNPHLPIDLLEKLSKHENNVVRRHIAINPNTPTKILQKLADDDDYYVRINVANHPNTSLEVLFKKLIRESKINIYIAHLLYGGSYGNTELNILDIFAEESDSSLETILQRLIDDCEAPTRTFLAGRYDLPVEFLQQLAQESKPGIQEAVANNPNTPNSSLWKLAQSESVRVRLAVAQNSHSDWYTLEKLAHDDNVMVRRSAMSNSSLLKKSIEQILCGEYAAEYPQCNPDFLKNNPDSLTVVLDYYTGSQSQLTSYIVLLQPQVSQKRLEEKSLSVSWLDRFAVAQNNSTSTDILKRLTRDCNQLVRAVAKDNLLCRVNS